MSPLPQLITDAAGELAHGADAFDPAAQRANAEGWGDSGILERFAWDYEILAQLRREMGDSITAFGGMNTMLYLPLEAQRASVDVDVFCALPPEQFEEGLRRIEARLTRFDVDGYYFRFMPREPQLQVPLPKRAYDVCLPSAAGNNWRRSDADQWQPGCHIKVEVLFVSPPVQTEQRARVLPFKMTGPHFVLPRPHVTGMKILALASGEVGLPPHRLEEMVKHVYDLAQLLPAIKTTDDLAELQEATTAMLELENRFHKPQATARDCAVAVKATLALLGRSVINERADAFAATYLRHSPSPESWAIWGHQVRHLAFVATSQMGHQDFLRTKLAIPRLLLKHVPSKSDKALRSALRRQLRQLDQGSSSREDQFHAFVFADIAFRVGYEAARAVVDGVLGAGWDAQA